MKNNYKYIIVGAGAAGLQMAYFLKQLNLQYLVIEKKSLAGDFFNHFPVHGKLISINKKYNFFEEATYNLRYDWNSLLSEDEALRFTNYSDDLYPDAKLLSQYLNDFAKKHQLNIQYNTTVENISKDNDDLFLLKLNNNEIIKCKVLFLATGALKQHMPKEIENIALTTPYSKVSLNTDKYKNKRIAIIGSGNSAFETADSFANTAAFVHIFVRNKLKMSYETHFVGHLRAKYTNIFDMYQLKALHAVLKPRIKKITCLENGSLQTQHEYDYPDSKIPGTLKLTREYDYIINCTGFEYTHQNLFDDAILPDTIMDEKFYSLNEYWQSKNIENLYCIGTLMQAVDKKAASGFIHGFRYNIRTLANIINQKYENKDYPYETHAINPFIDFLKQLYQRFSISDALFQLYGFLGDKLVYNEKEQCINWYKELPVNYIKQHINTNEHTFILTLEFGFHHFPDQSSLEFMGPSDPNHTEKSVFLHPVIRHYYKDQTNEFHFGDSLLARWDLVHADGGAIASYHAAFYNWVSHLLGLGKEFSIEIGENPNYFVWND